MPGQYELGSALTHGIGKSWLRAAASIADVRARDGHNGPPFDRLRWSRRLFAWALGWRWLDLSGAAADICRRSALATHGDWNECARCSGQCFRKSDSPFPSREREVAMRRRLRGIG